MIAIPVRSFHEGKTRLAPVLGIEERTNLVRNMFDTVIDAVVTSGVADMVGVVSPDAAVLSTAGSIGQHVQAIRQSSDDPGLIAAAELARRTAMGAGARRLIILFGDLPSVTPDDIRALAAEVDPVVIATDWLGGGTNGLLLLLDDDRTHQFQFAYGSESRMRHEAEAQRLGLSSRTMTIGGVAHDLDTTEDFRALIASGRDLPGWLWALPIQQQETPA